MSHSEETVFFSRTGSQQETFEECLITVSNSTRFLNNHIIALVNTSV